VQKVNSLGILAESKNMAIFEEKMTERFGGQFKENEPLAKHVNMKIGGPAKFFVEAKISQDIVDAVSLAKENGIEFFILGGGSNTLVADEGYSGLVIKAANRNVRIEGNRVIAEAGVISALVARKSAEAGLRGFEWAVSLPGTIGGAVRGNAGCFGGETVDTLESVKLLRNGEIIDVPAKEMKLTYRNSVLKQPGNQDVVLEATFKLTPGDRAEALAQIDKNLDGRKKTQPLGAASAGCMFKNFEFNVPSDVRKIEETIHVPVEMFARKRIAAGWIIDQLGLKGTRVGDAMVSEQHGNFLMNMGHATAKEIKDLISQVKAKVKERYGIELHEEVQYLGEE
jgi:UDP-N-acetylmuramate dehydrogenase